MRSIYIKREGNLLPKVVLDADEKKFSLEGDIYVNPDDQLVVLVPFFTQIFDWLEEYNKQPNSETVFYFKLDHIRDNAREFLLELLYLLKKIRL